MRQDPTLPGASDPGHRQTDRSPSIDAAPAPDRIRRTAAAASWRDLTCLALERLPLILVVLDPVGRISEVNPFFEELAGRDAADIRGADWFGSFVSPRDRPGMRAAFESARSGDSVRDQIFALTPSGSRERRIQWQLHPPPEAPEIECVLLIGQDISELEDARRRSERAELEHRRSEDRQRAILDGLFAFVGIFDLEGNLIEANRPPLEQAGLSRDEVIGRPFWETYWWTYSRDTQTQIRQALATASRGATVRKDYWARMANDRFILIDTLFSPLRDAHGVIIGSMGSGVDVTEDRRTEATLRSQSQVLHSMDEGVFFLDAEGVIQFANPALEKNFGYASGALIGRHLNLLAAPEPDVELDLFGRLTRASGDDHSSESEFLTRRSDGSPFYSQIRMSVFPAPSEVQWFGIQCDITERKSSEQRIRASLHEKELLLREVHHRVKNNLQVISGLLDLHARRVHDERDLLIFEDIRRRLLSMHFIHENLHRSHDLTGIQIARYVRSLSLALVDSLDARNIRVHVDADDIQLPIATALPLGMILSELLTNVFKYAFPDTQTGSASVRVRRLGDTLTLAVADAGRGFPSSFDHRRTETFGWRLINVLTLQLRGQMQVENRAGAFVEIRCELGPQTDSEAL